MGQPPDTRSLRERKASRREFLKRSTTGLATLALAPGKVQALDFESFFQKPSGSSRARRSTICCSGWRRSTAPPTTSRCT